MRRYLALVAASLMLVALGKAAFQNDFSSYPSNAQACLYAAAGTAGCGGDTAMAVNSCLCSNGGNFVTKIAKCMGTADAPDLGTVYDRLDSQCSETNTPLTVPKAQFLQDSGASMTTSVTTKSTTRQTSDTATTLPTTMTSSTAGVPAATGTGHDGKGSEDQDSGGRGISGSTRAGIIGASACGGALALGVLGFLLYRKRMAAKAGREEAHPMLVPKIAGASVVSSFDGAATGPGADLAHDGVDVGAGFRTEKGLPVSETRWRESWRRSQRFNWESPYEPPWVLTPGDARDAREAGEDGTEALWEPSLGAHNPQKPGGYQRVGSKSEAHELATPDARVTAPLELAAAPPEEQSGRGAGWATGR